MIALAPEPSVVTLPSPRAPHPALLDLAAGLRDEAQIIEALRTALLEQRAAVASDDGDKVDLTVQEMGRSLLTLQEARRLRTALIERLAGSAVPLEGLEAALGAPLPAALSEAREAVRAAAQRTTIDLAINQRVLRGALDAGEDYIQQLFSSAGDPASGYGTPRAESGGETSFLLNRMV